jgi:hypothetical protein
VVRVRDDDLAAVVGGRVFEPATPTGSRLFRRHDELVIEAGRDPSPRGLRKSGPFTRVVVELRQFHRYLFLEERD